MAAASLVTREIVDKCRICDEALSQKSRRTIFSATFQVPLQLSEVLGNLPKIDDGESSYVCNVCYRMLSKLQKIEFDLMNSMNELRLKKDSLLASLRSKYTSTCLKLSTPVKQHKRKPARQTPTPRKVKRSASNTGHFTPDKNNDVNSQVSSDSNPKFRKKLNFESRTTKQKEFTPGKVKVTFRSRGYSQVHSRTIQENDIKEIIKGLARGYSVDRVSKKLLKSKLSLSIQSQVIKILQKECKKMGKQSMLLECSSDDLQDFKFKTLNHQIQMNAPLLYKTIDILTNHNEKTNAVIVSLLQRNQNIQLSRLHHIIAQVLDHGGATDETINILNKLGLCVGASAAAKKRTHLQESQAKHIKSLVLDEMPEKQSRINNSGMLYTNHSDMISTQIIGDNLDISRHPSQMSADRQRKSWHWFLLVALQNRVTFPTLPDLHPQADISVLENKAFIPNAVDSKHLDENLTHHIKKVLVKYLPCFKKYEEHIPKFITHPYMHQLSQKSDFAILDLLDKNENKSEDMISILEHLHEHYIPHTDDDSPFVIKKKVFGGDVLTNERAYSAQLAMMNSPTDFTQLKGVIHRPEGLHRMMNYLLFLYQRFYCSSSAADHGTLYQLRNVVGRLDVKGPDDVISSYRAHYSFIQDCLDAYIVGACMHMLGIEQIEGNPPEQTLFMSDEKDISYIAQKILMKYIKNSDDISRVQFNTAQLDIINHKIEEMFDRIKKNYRCKECGKDYKSNKWLKKHLVSEHNWDLSVEIAENSKIDHIAIYRSSFMKCALLLRDTCDAYKLGDGDRILRNSKFEMLCADVGKHFKYRLWLFRFIAYCISILSHKQSMEYLWNCTANTTGGLANNIPNDNLVELLVQNIKKKIHQQGANATFSSARKAALSTQVQNRIRANLSDECEVQFSGKKRPIVNKTNDIRLMIAELFKSDVFESIPGRSFRGYPNMKDVFSCIKSDNLCEWITLQKKRASQELL